MVRFFLHYLMTVMSQTINIACIWLVDSWFNHASEFHPCFRGESWSLLNGTRNLPNFAAENCEPDQLKRTIDEENVKYMCETETEISSIANYSEQSQPDRLS